MITEDGRKRLSNSMKERWKNNRDEMLTFARKGLSIMKQPEIASKAVSERNKTMWRENRDQMLQYARKAFRKSLASARKKKYTNSKGIRMSSPGEIQLSEELEKLNIKYIYEKYLGYAIPDFMVDDIIIEVAGLPYRKYWERLENKYNKYIEENYSVIVWNTSTNSSPPINTLSNINDVISTLRLKLKTISAEKSALIRS